MAEKYTLTQGAAQWLVEKIKGADDGVKELKNHTRVNLLRHTLGTTTINGVTCTNNGDGTYTLNGTASGDCYFDNYITLKKGTYNIPPTNIPGVTVAFAPQWYMSVFSLDEDKSGTLFIYVGSGTTVNNLVVKPMITTDLTATYDDFVSYEDSLQPGINTGLKMDLLWTNASPTSYFEPQTISLDLSKYKIILIQFFNTIQDFTRLTYISFKDEVERAVSLFPATTLITRKISVNNAGCTFFTAYAFRNYNDANSTEESTAYVIPYKIYGVK